jgi:hypothetical protein
MGTTDRNPPLCRNTTQYAVLETLRRLAAWTAATQGSRFTRSSSARVTIFGRPRCLHTVRLAAAIAFATARSTLFCCSRKRRTFVEGRVSATFGRLWRAKFGIRRLAPPLTRIQCGSPFINYFAGLKGGQQTAYYDARKVSTPTTCEKTSLPTPLPVPTDMCQNGGPKIDSGADSFNTPPGGRSPRAHFALLRTIAITSNHYFCCDENFTFLFENLKFF